MAKMRSEGTYPGRLFDSCILGEWVTCWGGGGEEGFTVLLLLFSDYLVHICPRRHCVFTSYLKWQWAYKPMFFLELFLDLKILW